MDFPAGKSVGLSGMVGILFLLLHVCVCKCVHVYTSVSSTFLHLISQWGLLAVLMPSIAWAICFSLFCL